MGFEEFYKKILNPSFKLHKWQSALIKAMESGDKLVIAQTPRRDYGWTFFKMFHDQCGEIEYEIKDDTEWAFCRKCNHACVRPRRADLKSNISHKDE